MHTHVVNRLLRGMVGGFALIAAGNAFAAPSNGWDWMIAPYGWAATVGTDVETRVPPSGISVETSFDDIVDKIDGAFQIHVEGEGDDFGVFADFTYLGLASERDRILPHGNRSGRSLRKRYDVRIAQPEIGKAGMRTVAELQP